MKRVLFILSLLCALSCQTSQLPDCSPAALVSKVFVEGSEASRTSLSGKKVLWDDNDKVGVFDSAALRRFNVTLAEGGALIRGEALEQPRYVLLYPYDSGASSRGDVVGTVIPTLQRPVKDGFDPGAALMAALAEGDRVSMKNVGGLLRFSVSGGDVCGVMISSAQGIAGNVQITFDKDGVPAASGADCPYVRAVPSDSTAFSPGVYSLTLAPGTYEGGIVVEILKTDGTAWKKASPAALSIRRSGVTALARAVDEGELTQVQVSSSALTVSSPHPRLFATGSEFRDYKAAVESQKTKSLYLMHNEVMATAVRAVNRATVLDPTLDKSFKRMLDMARDAFGQIFFCAYAFRYTGDRKFLVEAEDLLNQICDFKDWNKQNHYLDTSTLTQAAAVGYDWLYDFLSEDTKRKLETKVFEYSLSDCLTDASAYLRPTSGWNATITSGIIMGASAFYEVNPTLCNKLLETAVPSTYEGLRCLLSTDGADYMGTMYWKNFAQIEMLTVSALKSVFFTDFGVSSYEGYRNTASWFLQMTGNTGKTFAFGDNNTSGDVVPAMYYHSVLFNDPSIPYFEQKLASRDQVLIGGLRTDDGTVINARSYPLSLLWASKYEGREIPTPASGLYKAVAGVSPTVIARTGWGGSDLYLGFKGGKASVGHGHSDVGSICYEADGVRWIDDPTQDEYAAIEKRIAELGCGDLWSYADASVRWKSFRISCRQHSTFTVNDVMHKPSATASFTSFSEDVSAMGAELDMTATLNGSVSRASRKALLKNASMLEITDHIEALPSRDAVVRVNFNTLILPEVTAEGIVLTSGGKSVLISAGSRYAVSYRIFTNNPAACDFPAPFCDAEELRPEEYYCGFTVTVPAGEKEDIITTITSK